jgi:hypothetical protein
VAVGADIVVAVEDQSQVVGERFGVIDRESA